MSYSTPALTDSFWPPTIVSPAGKVKLVLPMEDAIVLMFKWYCSSFSGISSTLMYSSWPPLTLTSVTVVIFSSSGTILSST